MTTPPRSLALLLPLFLFALLARSANLNYTGEALTTRFWDCCKPSCGWNGKASVSSPVGSCAADNSPIDLNAGTGCKGGTAFQCAEQQPWAVNETLAYGFAGVFLTKELTRGGTEDAWCCACYRLEFTSEPLRGKSMVVQASNTAYDVNTANRFTLAIPGGNTTSADGCAQQYDVSPSVFGQDHTGVASKEDCQNLPEPLRPGCEWRFDWLQDASFPSASFTRVLCPSEITAKTGCVRNDDATLAEQLSGTSSSSDDETGAKTSNAHMANTRASLRAAGFAAGFVVVWLGLGWHLSFLVMMMG